MTKIHELTSQGQSIWFDYIRRMFIKTGELQSLLDQGVPYWSIHPHSSDAHRAEAVLRLDDGSSTVIDRPLTGEIVRSQVITETNNQPRSREDRKDLIFSSRSCGFAIIFFLDVLQSPRSC